MHRTVVINVVGLTQRLAARLPSLKSIGPVGSIGHVTPAVTCSVQATYLTGKMPAEHGIVGNGWYFRDQCEIRFWHQSDQLVQRPRIWQSARKLDPNFTCANLFWWHAMYSSADITVTPRPMYPSDGRKVPDIWTNPPQLRHELQAKLGQFPLFNFWGPGASIRSSQWIARAAVEVDRRFKPTLTLIYLPHLDYALQKLGPDDPAIDVELASIDKVLQALIDHFRDQQIVVLSEYGITPVDRPVHLNRLLRAQKLLVVRDELGRELFDPGASAAFAVADHQIAHVYVNDRAKLDEVRELVRSTPGVAEVLDGSGQQRMGLNHERSGDLVALAAPGSWFTYYYWIDDSMAPDFARTVDIHRKPGYDPVELFAAAGKLRIGWKLLKRKLGFRTLLDAIPLRAELVRGSHGIEPADPGERPVLISSCPQFSSTAHVNAIDVHDLLLRYLTGDRH